MDRKVTGHSADFIKRQATKLKKEMGIPHHEALDKAAQNAGFTNWKNFLNSSASPRPSPRPTPQPARSRPRPLALPYHPMLSKAAYQRPNAKMPIKAHQEIGRLLKEARVATLFHKKAEKEIDSVRCTLDDWVQREYPPLRTGRGRNPSGCSFRRGNTRPCTSSGLSVNRFL